MAMSGASGKADGSCQAGPVVVFGGTFDPIHNGHMAVAQSLLDALQADPVLIVPAGRPWLRADPLVASAEDRLRMAQLAVGGESGIEVSDVDVVRDKTTYSVDTIQDLRDRYGSDRDFVLAIGSDAASELHRWHRYEDLVGMCRIAVVRRPGVTLTPSIDTLPNSFVIDGPMMDVSASEIRTSYASEDLGNAAAHVPKSVHEFIIDSGLYR